MLCGTGKCASFSETTLLLRFLGDEGQIERLANFRESNIPLAVADLRDRINNFDSIYERHTANLFSEIYENISDGCEFVIDKTPRYTLIANDLLRVFPNAHFIILWRHPLAVLHSIIETFGGGSWRLYDFLIDFFRGAQSLYDFQVANRDRPNVTSLKYEELVADPIMHIRKLGECMGSPEITRLTDVKLEDRGSARLGDPSGSRKYSTVSGSSLNSWQVGLDNWYRRRWAKRIFYPHGERFYEALGYEYPQNFEAFSFSGFTQGIRDFKENYTTEKRSRRRILRKLKNNYRSMN
jgi:hypothetical protein